MMDRNREARRGSMAAVNGTGGGLSRRRQQRSSNLRDSPEDGAMEMQESSRLRYRGVKKDRDRDRSSSRSKRRRGERLMHGSNREEGDDTSEESVEDDDDDEEEDASVSVRLPPPVNSSQIPSASSSIQQHQNHHHHVRKGSFPKKPVRLPMPSWKVTEEMIGVSIPRKARSSSVKRPQDWVSGGGSGELISRQASTSPARLSPPSSSNVSVRKKKLINGNMQRPLKIAKTSTSTIQEDIEIEVAEVLFGMTRQAPPSSNKQDNNREDTKDANGLSTEAKSRVSSPNSISQTPATLQSSVLSSPSSPMVATAPKRKKPRLRLDEGSPTSPASSVAPLAKTEPDMPPKTEEAASPISEKNPSASPAVDNGCGSIDPCGPVEAAGDLAKSDIDNQIDGDTGNLKEETAILPSKADETPRADATSINFENSIAAAAASKGAREEKFSLDLMDHPLPEKSFERDGIADLGLEKKMLPGSGFANGNLDKVEKASMHEGTSDQRNAGNFLFDDFNLKKQTLKEKIPDLQVDLEKHDEEGLSLSCGSKQHQQQAPKQQHKSTKIDSKEERPAPSAPLPLPVPIAGWPGGFPPFGYMGQVPSVQAVVPMDAAAKAVQQPPHFLQPHVRPKRCATHSYIAQNIHYHQQMARLNPFYAAAAMAASAAPLYGAKQYNLNAVPPSETAAILGNPLQGAFPPRSSAPPIAMAAFPGPPPPNEKSSAAAAAAANGNTYMDPAAQRKRLMLSQSSQPGGSMAPPNMNHGPAFIFPITTQQPAMANRSGASSKSTPGTGNASAAPSAVAPTSSAAAGSGATGHTASTMSFNYAGLTPTNAQYMTILQNNAAYPFPIASAHAGGSTPYRGASPAQAMPFLNGPFYSSQMANQQQQFFQMQQEQLKQLQQHQQEQIRQHQQKAHQNQSTSSGSSSSQKHSQQSHQQQRAPTSAGAPAVGSNSHSFPSSKPQLHLLSRPDTETGCDSPSTADSSNRVVSQAQKGSLYGQNFSMPIHSQNFALISPAAVALAGSGSSGGVAGAGGGRSENKQQHQAMKVDLTPSQAYAMSFASFGGSAAAAASASGLDFSAIVQNPTLLQNLSEAARHGYHQIPAAAVAAAATAVQAAQHNKDGKSFGGSAAVANANAATDDAKIAAASGGKSVGQQHSLSFSRPDDGSTNTNFIGNITDASARALNLLHPPVNGARTSNPTSSAPTSSTATNSPSSQHLPSSQSKQQYNLQMIQLQQQQQQQQRIMMMQQQQQQMQMQQQKMSRNAKSSATTRTSSNNNISTNAMAAAAVRLPQGGAGAGGFVPSIIPAGGSTGASNSPQWKPSSSGRTITAAPASSATSSSSSAKNQMFHQQQQQQQQQQQPLLTPGPHHTQISFGASNKPLSSSALEAGSPQNSLSKISAAATSGGGNSGSPRASSSSKSGQPPSPVMVTPLQQQQAIAAAAAAASKNSPSAASSLKPSSITGNNSTNRNNSSILGHPNITPSSNSVTKKLQQQQQQQHQQHPQSSLQKHPFQQPQQSFFNNPYIQAQTSQSNQLRRQSEEHHHQQLQNSTSGMLSLSASSDPAKSAGSSIKGLTTTQAQAGILHQHTAQFATTSIPPHPFISAAFPYMHSMQSSSASVKHASAAATDQKQPAGNENVHACWKQPEKR